MHYNGLNDKQKAMAHKSLQDILNEAALLPARPEPRKAEDMIPVLKMLRNEKKLGWPDISRWMRDNTEFDRSDSFWNNLYKGKKMGIMRVVTEI